VRPARPVPTCSEREKNQRYHQSRLQKRELAGQIGRPLAGARRKPFRSLFGVSKKGRESERDADNLVQRYRGAFARVWAHPSQKRRKSEAVSPPFSSEENTVRVHQRAVPEFGAFFCVHEVSSG
jgi:hypothetical protein